MLGISQAVSPKAQSRYWNVLDFEGTSQKMNIDKKPINLLVLISGLLGNTFKPLFYDSAKRALCSNWVLIAATDMRIAWFCTE